MSKLDELIKELCPNGCEYKNFNEVAKYVRGVTYGKGQEVNDGSDGYKLLRANNITLSSNTLNFDDVKIISREVRVKDSQILKKGDILICAGSGSKEHIGKVAYIFENIDYTFGGFMGVVRTNSSVMLSSFMFHILSGSLFKKHLQKVSGASSSTINNINNDTWRNFVIPVPPMAVQEEIVRILDNFTALTAELTAELTARKKQYEFYRDELLTFGDVQGGTALRECGTALRECGTALRECGTALQECGMGNVECGMSGRSAPNCNNVTWKTLEDVIISLNTGLNPRQFFKLNTDDACNYYVTIREIQNGTVVFSDKTDRINDEAMRLCNNRSNLEVGDVLFSGTGTIGETAVISEPPTNWNIKEGVYVIKPQKNVLNSRFLMYILRTNTVKSAIAKKVAGGTVKSIPMAEMRKLRLPIPSLEIQNKIVSILDRFDSLCNDISEGLPAEIEARQKQYEYYRDALLNYAAKGVAAL
jgi:type I restriction enzyme, S subunit